MTKHIIGQSFYQITVLCVIIFYGDQFIPESLSDVKDIHDNSLIYSNGTQYIRSGRLKLPFSLQNDYHPLEIVTILVLYSRSNEITENNSEIWTF